MDMYATGIDLAKHFFQIHGVDKKGKCVLKKKLSRTKLTAFIANLPKCIIGMEACGGAHFWAREFQKLGHNVKLMSPQFVKPYVKSNKNDMADAEAICEAVTRANMRFVPIKQVEQQDVQSVHRVRERLVKSRTALSNEIRGLLHKYGIILPKGISNIQNRLPFLLDASEQLLTPMSRQLFDELLEEFRVLNKRLSDYDQKIKMIHQRSSTCQRLSTIPGVGPLTATAMTAAVGDARAFKNGRQLSAWLGLVPKQHSSGGKEKLLGISKRGDGYLRKLLIHGARSSLQTIDNKNDRRSLWLKELIERRGMNRATVALANKNARTIWALLTTQEEYNQTA